MYAIDKKHNEDPFPILTKLTDHRNSPTIHSSSQYVDDYDRDDNKYHNDNDYKSEELPDPYYEESWDSGYPYVDVVDEDGNEASINTITGNDEYGNHYTRDPFTDEWTQDDD